MNSSSTGPLAVACPTTSQCTAIDTGVRQVTFNPMMPGTPAATAIQAAGSSKLSALSCPTASQCTVINAIGGETTFDPTTPGAPSHAVVDNARGVTYDVACPTVGQCTAINSGGQEVTFNPAAPGTPTPRRIDGAGSSGGSATATVGHARASGTNAAVPVSCAGATGASCRVELTLTVVETVRGGKIVTVSAKHAMRKLKTSKRTIVVGAATITVAGGKSTTAHVGLNGTARRLLARRHKLAVKLTATQASAVRSTQTVTFKSRFKQKKHKHH